jgi:hypothetical protein
VVSGAFLVVSLGESQVGSLSVGPNGAEALWTPSYWILKTYISHERTIVAAVCSKHKTSIVYDCSCISATGDGIIISHCRHSRYCLNCAETVIRVVQPAERNQSQRAIVHHSTRSRNLHQDLRGSWANSSFGHFLAPRKRETITAIMSATSCQSGRRNPRLVRIRARTEGQKTSIRRGDRLGRDYEKLQKICQDSQRHSHGVSPFIEIALSLSAKHELVA